MLLVGHGSIFCEGRSPSVCVRSCCKYTHRSQNGQTLFPAPSVTSSPMGTLGRFARRINLVASPKKKKARSGACLGTSIWQQNISFCCCLRAVRFTVWLIGWLWPCFDGNVMITTVTFSGFLFTLSLSLPLSLSLSHSLLFCFLQQQKKKQEAEVSRDAPLQFPWGWLGLKRQAWCTPAKVLQHHNNADRLPRSKASL